MSRKRPVQTDPIFLVNGEKRSLESLRTAYGDGFGWMGGGRYAPSTLVDAYRTGASAYMCINARAGMASEIPIRVEQGEGQIDINSPAQWLVDDAARIIWRLIAFQMIFGVFYLLKQRNSWRYASRLMLVSPAHTQPDMDYAEDMVRGYWVTRGGHRDYYKASEVIAGRLFDPESWHEALSPLEVAMVRSGIETNIGKYAQAFFKNSARPDLLLAFEGTMSAEEQRGYRNYWEGLFKGVSNFFRTAIMGGEMGGKWTVTPISAEPADLAMKEAMDAADAKICGVFGVNPALVGLGGASDPLSAQGTFAAIRQHALETTALGDVRRVLDTLNTQWLIPEFGGRWHLVPDTSAIVGASLGTGERSVTARENVKAGLWTLDEGREYTGKTPLVGGVQRDPSGALALYQGGLIRHDEARREVGLPPAGNEGYVWEVDPRARPAPAMPFFGGQGLAAVPPSSSGVARALAAPLPVDHLSEDGDGQEEQGRVLIAPPDVGAQLRELDLWRQKVKRYGAAVRFYCASVGDELERYVRVRLGRGDAPPDVFQKARDYARSRRFAMPEDAEDYWRDLDQLQGVAGAAWADYMAQVWAAVSEGADANLPTRLESLLSQFEIVLLDQWVGTPAAPGVMLKIALAGLTAGQRELVGASVQRVDPAAAFLDVSFDLLSQEALAFIQGYLPSLIRRVNQTTLDAVRREIEAWLSGGGDVAALRERLETIFADRRRAELIAQTEMTRLYAEGSLSRFTAAGVQAVRFRTVRDEFVCPVCEPLNEQTTPITRGFEDGQGRVRMPPMHPGCRCRVVPVVERL